jgi:hypothetical protein
MLSPPTPSNPLMFPTEPNRKDSIFGGLSFLFLIVALSVVSLSAAETNQPTNAAPNQWMRGLTTDTNFFPVAVWLQSPDNAERYKAAGINTYVALYRGPTDAQLAKLKAAGLLVICEQNKTALQHLADPTIVGWMHGDEPDNAQSKGQGKGYGPPILPEKIVEDYRRIREADPSRPVLLNLGQGVAWDNWYGRGVRTRHPEDYPEYLQGCDLASFDIYPVTHDHKEVTGKLEFVAQGVERLVQWTGDLKPVWSCIECTHIGNEQAKPTPEQVRSEVWMALVRGARGLIYFVHEFKPKFKEAALLDDPPMLAAVTTINRQIRELAPVLNAPIIESGTLKSEKGNPSVAYRYQTLGATNYLFAVNLSPEPATVTFAPPARAELGNAFSVLGEDRTVPLRNKSITDRFEGYQVHLYRDHPQSLP